MDMPPDVSILSQRAFIVRLMQPVESTAPSLVNLDPVREEGVLPERRICVQLV